MVDALDYMAGLVLDDGRRWGDAALGFQWDDARAILGASEPPYHFLTRARGASKTTDLAGMAASLLLTVPGRTQFDWLAADQDQGQLAIEAIAGFAARTGYLGASLDVQTRKVVATRTGSTLTVLAADAPSVWGRAPRVAFVDELAQWATTPGPRKLWEGVSSSVAKRADAQLVVLTTAGSPGHWAHGILNHAKADSLWRVHEVAGPPPWMDEARIDEQRRRLPESSFRRLFLNEWALAEDRLTAVEDLDACVTLDGPQEPIAGMKYLIGVDLGLTHDRSVAAVCHREGPIVVLDRMQVWSGSRRRSVDLQAVEDWLLEAHHQFFRAGVVVDPWQAVAMAQRLRGRGVVVVEHTFSATSNAKVALTLHRLLADGALALPNDGELLSELANVRLRESSPGVYRLDHDVGAHDDRAVALGLAAFHLMSRGVPVDHAAIGQAIRSANLALVEGGGY